MATVALMQESRLPCFGRGAPIPNLRKRFHLDMTEAKAAAFMRSTILDAYDKVIATCCTPTAFIHILIGNDSHSLAVITCERLVESVKPVATTAQHLALYVLRQDSSLSRMTGNTTSKADCC